MNEKKENIQNNSARVVVKRGDVETSDLKWDDLLEMNKEVKRTLKEIIDEVEKFKNELSVDETNQDAVKNMLQGLEKELEGRYNEIKLVEKLHSKEKIVDENGKKIKKTFFFKGSVVQDPNYDKYDPKLFEVYLIAINQYANILVKLESVFNIGKLTILANANLAKGETNGTTK